MNSKNLCITACACAIAFVGLGACEATTAAPASVTTTTSYDVFGNEHASSAITGARCNREKACNNIGRDKKWESLDACTSELGHDTGSALRADECRNGVRAERLEKCLNDIRNERCGNPLDTIERVAACRKGMLCP